MPQDVPRSAFRPRTAHSRSLPGGPPRVPRGLPALLPPVAFALALALAACGVPQARYDQAVTHSKLLEKHLTQKMKRMDLLEAQAEIDQTNARNARAATDRREAALQAQLTAVKQALATKDRALAPCQKAAPEDTGPAPVVRVARRSECARHGVALTLDEGLLAGAGRAPGATADPRTQALRRAVGALLPGITRCALMRHGRRKAALEGALVMTLAISPRGRAGRAKLVHRHGNVGHVARCVSTALRGLRLPAAPALLFAALPFRFAPSKPFLVKAGCTPVRRVRERAPRGRRRKARRRARPR